MGDQPGDILLPKGSRKDGKEKHLSKPIPGVSADGDAEAKELKWIHLRYHPPGLALQYSNERTIKLNTKMLNLLDFNRFSNLEETAEDLMRTEKLLTRRNRAPLVKCLQKLQDRCLPDFKKKFKLQRSIRTHSMLINCARISRDGSK